MGYSANLWLRAAIRVVALLAEGSLERGLGQGKRGADALYDLVYAAVPWHQVIPPGATFSVEPRLWSCTDLRSAAIAWTAIKDAVCDAIRDARGSKPAPPAPGAVADVPLYVTLYNDQVRESVPVLSVCGARPVSGSGAPCPFSGPCCQPALLASL